MHRVAILTFSLCERNWLHIPGKENAIINGVKLNCSVKIDQIVKDRCFPKGNSLSDLLTEKFRTREVK